MLTVYIEHDSDIECPADWDENWTLYSFCSRHMHFKHPNEFDLSSRKLKTKLKNGLAHKLSYFEHGNCLWFRKDGDVPPGVEFQWDGVEFAGLLIWEHPPSSIGGKTFEERAKDADTFLKLYTSWANGEGYYYRIEDEEGEIVGSCGGFYGCDMEHMLDEIARELDTQEFVMADDWKHLEDDLREAVRKLATA